MKSLIFLSLIILCLSETQNQRPTDIFANIKKNIYTCISTSSGISDSLKKLTTDYLESNANLPINFHNIELTQKDREVIHQCRRSAFRAPVRKPLNDAIPISLENAVHKRKKIAVITGQRNKPRKLGMVDGIKRLTAFKIQGIFTCIEEAQPAIKVIRNTVNLWKSQDFTSAIVNVYDNFQAISDGLTVCLNAIFPSE